MSQDYDVCVVGAGMVGAAFAGLLATLQPRLNIALLDRAVPAPFDSQAAPDLRVSALARSSQRVLEACQVWDKIREHRVSSYQRMCVWDESQSADQGLLFDAAEIAEPDLGAIVENNLVVHCLIERLSTLKNVELFFPSTVSQIEKLEEQYQIVLKDGRSLRTNLLVAADGARSHIRELAGIEISQTDYGQLGVVASLKTEKPNQQTAWQRFLKTGPLAFLPLSDGSFSIVWSCPQSMGRELLSMDDEDFKEAVYRGINGQFGEVERLSKRVSFPLSRLHATEYVKDNLALIGDAAHVVHPLAGQGANMGLLDAACLVQIINGALLSGEQYFERRVLRRYERWRKGENQLMSSALDGIKRVFETEALAGFRSFGLGLVNRSGSLKSVFIRRAMGLEGDLPDLVKN